MNPEFERLAVLEDCVEVSAFESESSVVGSAVALCRTFVFVSWVPERLSCADWHISALLTSVCD